MELFFFFLSKDLEGSVLHLLSRVTQSDGILLGSKQWSLLEHSQAAAHVTNTKSSFQCKPGILLSTATD